jgi:hypothetical protein
MIYEVNLLSNEQLQHLYIKESSRLLTGIDLKINHNSIQSLRLNLLQLDKEIHRRKTAIPKFPN